MATLTLPGSVSHTLPTKFWGIGHSRYAAHNDMPVTAYKTLCSALNMEVFRAHCWGGGTAASEVETAAMKQFAIDLGLTTMLQLNVDPNSASTDPRLNYPGDIKSSGSNGSPEDMATTLASWLSAGVDVQWLEPYNEPYNNYISSGGTVNGEGWKNTSAGYGDPGDACSDWAAIYQKPTYQRLRAAGVTTPIAGCVIAGAARDYIYNEVLRWAEPHTRISGTPRTDSNYPYFDTFSCHAYLTATGTQSDLNSIFYTGAPDSDDRSAVTAFCNNWRANLNANGKSSADMIFSECAIFDGGSVGALTDTAYAVAFARNQARWNVGCFIYHSIDTTNADFIICDNGHTRSTYQRTYRYRCLQQLVGPFIRNYKSQLFSDNTLQWSSAPGSSSAGSQANSVPRLQIAAGLNSIASRYGILVANVDLGTAENLVVNLPSGVTMSGAATYAKVVGGVSYVLGNDTAAMPTGTISGTAAGSTSFTQSIGAGESWLIEIPISGTIGGGGGGVTSEPNTGNWTTPKVVQASTTGGGAGDVVNVGNWTTPNVVTAETPVDPTPGASSLSLTPHSAGSLTLTPDSPGSL